MSAIDRVFADLRYQGRKALMPFVTAGDPDLAFTADVLRELASRGCPLCELGIPYSDPIADGPVIQASYTRALDRHVKLAGIFETIGRLTREIHMPVVSMVSYAIIFRHGPQAYIRDARAAGFAGAIVPDLPLDESEELAEICRGEDFSLIQLVTPTTPRERAVRIARSSSGFLYYVSVAGITGERRELPPELLDNVAWLKTQTDPPHEFRESVAGQRNREGPSCRRRWHEKGTFVRSAAVAPPAANAASSRRRGSARPPARQ